MNMEAPQVNPKSLWAATANTPELFPSLRGDIRARVVVIGGGFTGLSCALHLSEMSRDTVVLESRRPGWGASGRNGGQVIPGLKFDPDELEEMYGADLGSRVVQTVGSAADYLFSTINRLAIHCDANRSGWIQPAHAPGALATITRRAKQWIERGAPAKILDRDEVSAMVGSQAYIGGWLDLRGGSIQPLSYVQGLASAAARRGARIFSQTSTTSIRKVDGGWSVQTPSGSVTADKLVLATNAYSDRLWPKLARTIVPTFSLQVATEPLPHDIGKSILPGGHAASDTLRLLRYFRRDRDGRFILGARGPFKEDVSQLDAGEQIRAMKKLFPQLEGIKLEYVWSGQVAMTADHLPHINDLGAGAFAALGFNGRGVALTTTIGRLLAQLVAEGRPDEIDFPVSSMKPLPFHGYNRIAVRFLTQYYRLRDSIE